MRQVFYFIGLSISSLFSYGVLPASAMLPAAYAGPPQALSSVEFDRVEQNTIFFKSPPGTPQIAPLVTESSELQYLGTLHLDERAPYFLFKGRACRECTSNDDPKIFAYRPGQTKPTVFIQPGRIIDPKTRGVVLDSRAFFGKCIASRGDVYIVFQKEKVDRRHSLQTSVLIAEPDASRDFLQLDLIERRPPGLQRTLAFVKRKQCHEINGRHRFMNHKLIDLRAPAKEDDDDEDDADKNDEKTAATEDESEAAAQSPTPSVSPTPSGPPPAARAVL